MTSIGAATTHTVKVKRTTVPKKTNGITLGGKKKVAAGKKRGSAPPLQGSSEFRNAAAVVQLAESKNKMEQKEQIVIPLLRRALGEELFEKGTPHAASTTQSRGQAAADLAICAKHLGSAFVLKECDVMNTLQRMLFPEGLESLFCDSNLTVATNDNNNGEDNDEPKGLRPSLSSVSLASMTADDTTLTLGGNSVGSGADAKRGKTTPPNAREGSLLIIRALCENVGSPVEPYVITGFLAAALDECGSSSSAVREAASDAATALVGLASPWAFPRLLYPMLMLSLKSTEWRVKYNALERLSQCASPENPQKVHQVHRLLPKLIPQITSEVFDTKAQVGKAASSCLLAICGTCQNPDVKPAIPAVVHAISKPSETYKAVEELMGTTFVAPVDAPTLSILCPILSRALKEKLAIRKRSACLVIKNMSRLVENPEAVAPFGPLLLPELQKVSQNVQFEEIRDAALSALENLTKALGDAYQTSTDEAAVAAKKQIDAENARIAAEQEAIDAARREEEHQEEVRRQLEKEERAKFKEAMNAQRELDRIAAEEERAAKAAEDLKKEQQKLSTKAASGKCQACGLKKCKKSCMFAGK
mmetsp:Transcript_13796/g.20341  ORF Transcript_13796/g.20341 Transcript_13796/m.20341 type:complete len:590 (+) Transcript_13796:270-2039(+)